MGQAHRDDAEAFASAASLPIVDSGTFRNVMRKLAGSVTVISTEGDGTLHGFTATAVCSVCAEPPTILIVVNRSARTHRHIGKKGAFAVNILSDDQKEIADLFAGKSNEQFANIAYDVTSNGVPVIRNAAAFIECRISRQMDVGTHTIFIGHVVEAGAEQSSPLIYHGAGYARATTI